MNSGVGVTKTLYVVEFDPQLLDATTPTIPLADPKSIRTSPVPFPAEMLAPEGTDQLNESKLPVTENTADSFSQTCSVPEIAPISGVSSIPVMFRSKAPWESELNPST